MGIINVGILAHVDAGKTTTVEQLLYHSGAIKQPGSVDQGNTQTDWLEIERQRGISVRSASMTLDYRQTLVNLMDTPGHMDFTGEVERALYAVDCAVLVISAAEGVQSQTECFWRGIRTLGVPTLFFVNKIDRVGCDLPDILRELREKLSPAIVPLQRVEGAGTKACAVRAAPLGEDDTMALCELDGALAERFLAGETLDDASLRASLAALCARGAAYPLLYGAAALGVGTQALLDAMVDYLPRARQEADAPLSGTVYKIEHDRLMGKLAHVRLFAGTLRNRDAVTLNRPGLAEPLVQKATQIRHIAGPRQEDVGILTGGNIAAVCGLSDAKTGDMLGEELRERYVRLATPLFAVQMTDGAENPAPLLKAVGELADEDPLLAYEWVPEERELHIRVMGAIQLEVLAHLLAERYRLQVAFSPPTVIYKETPAKAGVGFEAYTMPKPCWAVIKLQLEPLARGAGYRFATVVPPREMLPRYQHHVETCLPEAMRQGLLGWEVTDVAVTLIGGEHHLIHTHPMDFFLATPMAFMDGMRRCGSQLLEPMLLARIQAEESLANRLIGDVLAMRGTFESPSVHRGQVTMEAMLPVASSLDFPVRLASLTGGKGRLSTTFAGYRDCPLELGATAKRRGVDPLDRAKWILHKRNAL